MSMARIRELAEGDITGVVALFEVVYPEHCWHSRTACESYFREIFLDNPWRDLEIPSWVAVDGGRIVGFAGVLPRRMQLRTRALRVAVGCQFMVHPDARHSLIALGLIKRQLAGNQDLFFSDGSNEKAKHLWNGIGGAIPILQNLDWTRLLRPTRYALTLLNRRRARRPLLLAAHAPCALADAVAARVHPNRFDRNDDGLVDEALDPAEMLSQLPQVLERSHPLRPQYDRASLTWLLGQAACKVRHGQLRARAVLERGRMLGWFIYYACAGTVNEVLQLAARDGQYDRVLQQLFRDAWRQGATALRGRLDPFHVQQLSNRHCWFRREGAWTLIHSRHPEIVSEIERGTAGFSRLDGEWWLRFIGG
jgi:hypothetical protein